MKHGLAGGAASRDKLMGVVTRASADDDDRVRVRRSVSQGGLSIFCRLANGIDKTNFRFRINSTNQSDNLPNEFDRLGCLRNNSVTRASVEGEKHLPGEFRTTASGKSPISPSTSTWPALPMTTGKNPAATRRFSSSCAWCTSGQVPSATLTPAARHSARFASKRRER